MDLEQRRDEVWRLIEVGVSQKLVLGTGQSAEAILEKARDLAMVDPRLPFPIPELAAYRLSQVLMRKARTKKDLQRIDRLLAFALERTGNSADGFGPLGVMPLCLRVIVQIRLSGADGNDRMKAITALMQKGLHALGIERRRATGAEAVQSHDFNLLELTVYMAGMDYDPLEGIGISLGPFGREVDASWIVTGSAGDIRPVRMPQDYAWAEVKDRVQSANAHFGYIAGTGHDFVVWPRGKGAFDVERVTSPHLGLVPGLCVAAQRKRLVRPGDEENVRVYLGRLKKLIAERLGRSVEETIVSEGRLKSERFHPDLRVACAFAEPRLALFKQ